MRVQAFAPSASAAAQCLPKWVEVHLYRVKNAVRGEYDLRPSVRHLVWRTNHLWDFHAIQRAYTFTNLSSNGFVQTDQWHWHLSKWCTTTATLSVCTSLPFWVEVSTDDLHLITEELTWVSWKPVQSKPPFSLCNQLNFAYLLYIPLDLEI
jgi:hypothetical protein